jgi:hypothetical protein
MILIITVLTLIIITMRRITLIIISLRIGITLIIINNNHSIKKHMHDHMFATLQIVNGFNMSLGHTVQSHETWKTIEAMKYEEL